jgi:hypothetical protein
MARQCGSLVSALVLLAPLQLAIAAQYQVSVKDLTVRLDDQGRIVGATLGPKKLQRALTGNTTLEGCRAGGAIIAQKLKSDGVEFSSKLLCAEAREGPMRNTRVYTSRCRKTNK